MKTYLCYCSLFCVKVCALDIDNAAEVFELDYPEYIGVPYYIQLIYETCADDI